MRVLKLIGEGQSALPASAIVSVYRSFQCTIGHNPTFDHLNYLP